MARVTPIPWRAAVAFGLGVAALGAVRVAAVEPSPVKFPSPIDQLSRPDKTELTDKDSNVAATGGEFGIPWMWWWHRINAGWGTVRPRVAQLAVYDELTYQTMTLQGGARQWSPDHLHQEAEMNGVKFVEDKSVIGDSLADVLQIQNGSSQPRALKLYFAGQPDAHSPGNPDSHGLSISFDAARNALLLSEEKDYGQHYLPGRIVVDQWIGSSAPIVGWALGTFPGDVDKLYGRDLGMGAFINDANLRKYVEQYSGDHFQYAFQINVNLAPGATQAITLATTFGTHPDADAQTNTDLIRRAPELLAAKTAEWRSYFQDDVPVLQSPDDQLNRLWYYIWYVLRSNSVKRGAAVTADFTVPTKFGYWGCYIWDSAFHALGQQHLPDPAVAENTIRAILSIQYPNGFLPVNSGADDVEVNTPNDGTYDLDPHDFYRYTEDANPFLGELEYRSPQPHQWGVPQKTGKITIQEKTMLPILGLAAWQVYQTTGDRAFLSEVYGPLSRYDDWLWRRRNAGDGLLVWYNPEESGWDNAARLLPLPVKTVDGSTMAWFLRRMLADSAHILGRDDDAVRYAQRAELTAHSIDAKMWDDRTGFYYDLSMDDHQRPQKSPAGFMPLMTGVVSPNRVALLVKHLQNRDEFATAAPVPSVSKDDPQFDPRTWGWNGPTWIPSNWLVMESFAQAGRVDLSNALMQNMVAMMTRPNGSPGAYEQYNSETGMPFGVADYSWSGAINDYLTRWVAGIVPDAARAKLIIAPHLFAEWTWFEIGRVHIGRDEIGYRYDVSPGKQLIHVRDAGPAPLHIELVLPATQTPRSVLLDGREMPSEAFRVDGGELHISLPGSGSRTIEVENP
jgi:GH15 family glucan-1,4-alpha-glucosidase